MKNSNEAFYEFKEKVDGVLMDAKVDTCKSIVKAVLAFTGAGILTAIGVKHSLITGAYGGHVITIKSLMDVFENEIVKKDE